MAYVTSTDVKLHGGWSSSDTFDDSLITLLIAQATTIIETFTDRVFESTGSDADSTRYFDAEADVWDYKTLTLDEDLLTIASIIVDGRTFASDSYVTEPRSDAPYWGITLLDSSSDTWDYGTDSENAIAVTGQWAYSSSAPADIQWATIRTVLWFHKQRNSSVDLDRPLLTDAGITIMPTRLPADVVSILQLYRKRSVGSS